MTDDRALLEAAAKAAGLELDYSIRPDGKAFYHSDRNAMALADGGWFAPLTDDGDALRLAVKLGIDVMQDAEVSEVHTNYCLPDIGHHVGYNTIEEYRDDPAAATRRAIVRAAAAMAKS